MDSALPCKWVTQMWEKWDIYLSSKYFLSPFFVRWRSVSFARSEGLYPLSYGSRFIESPSTNYFWHAATTALPPDSPTGLHRLQLPCTPPQRRVLGREPECVTAHIQPRCLQTCLWRMAETSRHWKLSPLPVNFAQLVLCRKTSTGSWRGGIAERDFWPSSHMLRSMCPKESLQMLILRTSKKAAGVEPEGTNSINSMPSKILIQEQALHQMHSFRLKVTFQWLLYWRSFSWNSSCALVQQQDPNNSQ